MKNLALLFLFLAFVNSSLLNGQQFSSNIKNREVIINSSDSTIRAYILNEKVDVKYNSLLNYYWYFQQQINMNKGGAAGNLLDGKYSVYNKFNALITSGEFKNGLKNGSWKKWDSKGNLLYESIWKKGIKKGNTIIYDSTNIVLKDDGVKSKQNKDNNSKLPFKNDQNSNQPPLKNKDVELKNQVDTTVSKETKTKKKWFGNN